MCSGTHLLAGLKMQEVSGQCKNLLEWHQQILNYWLVGPKIVKMDNKFQAAAPVQERLVVILQFLATGDSYTSLRYLFQISKQSDCT
jgi:hypothetical protein